MSCEPIRMPDGTVVVANVVEGETLTDEDKQAIAEWVQFCRDRKANREERERAKKEKEAKARKLAAKRKRRREAKVARRTPVTGRGHRSQGPKKGKW